MEDINSLLQKILSAVYGKDVRQSIHDAIKQCYTDAINPGYYTPDVDQNGLLSWEKTQSYMPDIPSVKVMGPKPEKGVDYFTEADKQDIIDAVLDSLPSVMEVIA